MNRAENNKANHPSRSDETEQQALPEESGLKGAPTTNQEAAQVVDWVEQWLSKHDMADDSLPAETSTPLHPHLEIQELLGRLNHAPQKVTLKDLFGFSDLSRTDAEVVRREWPKVPVEQRRRLLQTLNEAAAEDVEWVLGTFLRVAMRDTDAEVRRMAVEGLWEDDGPDLIGPFVQLLRRDEDVGVQSAVANALGTFVLAGELDEIDSALFMRVEEALLEVLEDPTQALLVQCRALESISYSSETGLHQLIEDAYYSPHNELRVSALRAMGRSADTRWRTLVRAELQNPDPAMRAEAAHACGELEAKSTVKELIQLLNDEEQIVRLSAIFALGRIGGLQAREGLRQIAKRTKGEEADAANEALEEMLFYNDGIQIDEGIDRGIDEKMDEEEDDLDELERFEAFGDSDDFEDDSEDDSGDKLDDSNEEVWDTVYQQNQDDWDEDEDEWEDTELDEDNLGEYEEDRPDQKRNKDNKR